MQIELRPVFGSDGDLVVFDIYVDGVWRGSRRMAVHALAEAVELVKAAGGDPVEARSTARIAAPD